MRASFTILGLDTAQPACSAALLRADGETFSRFEPMMKGHAEALAPMAGAVLAEAGLGPKDLDAIAVTTGPGTFTGTRAGLSFARALGLALARPVIGVTTLAALAEPVRAEEGEVIVAVFDARRGEVYLQCFTPEAVPLTDPALVQLEALGLPSALPPGPLCLAGTGAALVGGVLGGTRPWRQAEAPELPHALSVARLAARRIEAEGLPPASDRPLPLYLRAPDAKLPRAGGALR